MSTTSYVKGGFLLMAAQLVNLIAAFLTQVFLGIMLGPASYGVYGVVISAVSIVIVVLMGGIPLSITKFIAGKPNLAYTVKIISLKFQFFISSFVVLIYLIFAPAIANLLNDPSLTLLIQIGSIALLPRAISAVYAMYFNGLHHFENQAISWSIYGIGRLILSITLGYFFSVIGAILGFVIAPMISSLYGYLASKVKKSQRIMKKFDYKKMLQFSSYSILFFIGISFFQTIDLFLVKAILKDNVLTGYYNAAMTLSKLPFNILSTLALLVFPITAKFINKNNLSSMKNLIRESMRAILMMLLPLILLIASKSTEIVKLFYTAEYAPAGEVFMYLILSLGAFTLFYVYGSMILASNKHNTATLIVIVSVIVDFILIFIFTSKYGLVGAAIGTMLASIFATMWTLSHIFLRFGVLMSLKSLLRISFASTIVFFASFYIPSGKIFTVVGLGFLMMVYLGILWIIKELNINDVRRISSILPKRSKN